MTGVDNADSVSSHPLGTVSDKFTGTESPHRSRVECELDSSGLAGLRGGERVESPAPSQLSSPPYLALDSRLSTLDRLCRTGPTGNSIVNCGCRKEIPKSQIGGFGDTLRAALSADYCRNRHKSFWNNG